MKTITELTFANKDNYYKANRLLIANNYHESHHMNKGNGYYTLVEHWLSIEFNIDLELEILNLLNQNNIVFTQKNKQPFIFPKDNNLGYILS
jgi:hypothetical protein